MKTGKKIKILYGLEAAAGGSLKHVTYLVTHLNKELFEVTVILSPNRSGFKNSEIKKMQQHGATVILMDIQRSFNPVKDLLVIAKLFKHVRKHSYDIIHAHSSKAGFVFRIAGWLSGCSSLIYTPHCFYFQSKTGIVKLFYCLAEKILGYLTAYLIVSNDEKDHALKYNIAKAHKIININNAIKFNEYALQKQNDVTRNKLGIANNSTVIGCIGRLTEQKDLLTYIYSAREIKKECKNVVFLIVGDGELKNELQKLIINLALEDTVILTGEYEEISDIFSIIDILVSTSLWEGMPYVMLEAMWFKKPIVATDLGYKGLLYDNENSFLVKERDHKVFAEIIKKLIKNEALIKEMGEKGYLLVNKNFSFEAFIRKHENFYRSIVEASGENTSLQL